MTGVPSLTWTATNAAQRGLMSKQKGVINMKTIVDIAIMCVETMHESFVKYCFKAMNENTEVLPCIYCRPNTCRYAHADLLI